MSDKSRIQTVNNRPPGTKIFKKTYPPKTVIIALLETAMDLPLREQR